MKHSECPADLQGGLLGEVKHDLCLIRNWKQPRSSSIPRSLVGQRNPPGHLCSLAWPLWACLESTRFNCSRLPETGVQPIAIEPRSY